MGGGLTAGFISLDNDGICLFFCYAEYRISRPFILRFFALNFYFMRRSVIFRLRPKNNPYAIHNQLVVPRIIRKSLVGEPYLFCISKQMQSQGLHASARCLRGGVKYPQFFRSACLRDAVPLAGSGSSDRGNRNPVVGRVSAAMYTIRVFSGHFCVLTPGADGSILYRL